MNIPPEQQRIVVDWKEKSNNDETLGEAGLTKKSKVIVCQKKELSSNPEDIIPISVWYNGETTVMKMNKEQDAFDLVLAFFKVCFAFSVLLDRSTSFPKKWTESS